METAAKPETSSRALAWLAAAAFATQFAVLDLALRGARAWLARPVLLGDVASSVVLGIAALVLVSSTRARAARALVAAVAATLLVVQITIFRYYHAPLDVQVAASALFAWHDVRQVVVRSAPGLVAAIVVVAGLEYLALSLVRRSLQEQLPAPSRALGALAFAGLVSAGPRHATPEVRAVHALTALRTKHVPVKAAAAPLPPLLVERPLPNVLFVLTESVRAVDYRPSGDAPTAPETKKVTEGRVDLEQLRSVSSYTAVSVSAVLTARSQEGSRADILRSPSLFDFAHAARDRHGVRPTVAYYSAQSETVFETNEVRAAVDRFVSIETIHGRDVTEEEDYASRPFDRDVVDRFLADLPSMKEPRVAMLHLIGTHAPYYLDPDRAPFQPWDHVVTWSRMPKLHAAYEDSIYEQDRTVARAVRTFIEASAGRPWLVVFTSDHGEAFGEHGAIHHGQNLFDEQVHVPGWIAHGNGALDAAASRALADHGSRFVTHLDLLPTMLDAMGLLDNFAVTAHVRAMSGKSLLRPYEPRPPIPVTNCTGMFPCPLNTWGLYAGDKKLVARIYDGGWSCFQLGEPGGERPLEPSEPACRELRAVSTKTFPLLPNGQPNR
ncbi:MAG: sulfatase-like hydrolase/transferase [Deltaproteobacteria bacterium]|nr:sulfatase-like hydrolase/transferase [Deltaproteobacteria bacterium]